MFQVNDYRSAARALKAINRKNDPARIAARAERKIRRNKEMYDEAETIVKTLPGVHIGYIGNVDRHGDDRGWFVALDHPGRIGTNADRVGGMVSTEERGSLLRIVSILAKGFALNTGR